MAFVKWKIIRTPFINDSYNDENNEEITRFNTVNVIESLGARKGGLSFNVVNFNNQYFGKFRPRDKITIYRAINSAIVNTDTDLLMVGAVRNAEQKTIDSTSIFDVQCYNFSESIMNAIIFADPQGSNKTIPEALEEAVTSVKNHNPSFSVTWSGSNPPLNSKGNAFPNILERWFYEPFTKILNKYSTNEYTQDGRYDWYVNVNNELVWVKSTNVPDYTYNQLTDPDTKSIEINKDTDAVVNFVIVKGGTDPKGSPITARHQDFASSSRHGLKFKYYVSDSGFSKTQNEADMRRLGSSGNDGTLPGNIPGFSYPATSGQLKWLSVIGETSVTSDNDYVQKFRRYIKLLLRKEGAELVDNYSFGKLEISLEVSSGSKAWGIGDLISVTAYNVDLTGNLATRNLRVDEIRYGTYVDVFSLIEDKGTI